MFITILHCWFVTGPHLHHCSIAWPRSPRRSSPRNASSRWRISTWRTASWPRERFFALRLALPISSSPRVCMCAFAVGSIVHAAHEGRRAAPGASGQAGPAPPGCQLSRTARRAHVAAWREVLCPSLCPYASACFSFVSTMQVFATWLIIVALEITTSARFGRVRFKR